MIVLGDDYYPLSRYFPMQYNNWDPGWRNPLVSRPECRYLLELQHDESDPLSRAQKAHLSWPLWQAASTASYRVCVAFFAVWEDSQFEVFFCLVMVFSVRVWNLNATYVSWSGIVLTLNTSAQAVVIRGMICSLLGPNIVYMTCHRSIDIALTWEWLTGA